MEKNIYETMKNIIISENNNEFIGYRGDVLNYFEHQLEIIIKNKIGDGDGLYYEYLKEYSDLIHELSQYDDDLFKITNSAMGWKIDRLIESNVTTYYK